MTIRRPRRPSDDTVYIPIAFIQNGSISRAAKLVYMSAAARFQHDEPEPDVDTIVAETGLTGMQVNEGIVQLKGISDAEWNRMGL